VASVKSYEKRIGLYPFDELDLIETPTTEARRNAPRYSPEDLGKCLRGFRSESASLLRNGMQEFLFRA
jgi:hypothetical protein